jgi:hypothetical protein
MAESFSSKLLLPPPFTHYPKGASPVAPFISLLLTPRSSRFL